jgi:hypothetical protein
VTWASVTISARPDGVHHPHWYGDAACRHLYTDPFHGTIDQLRQAQTVCRCCPVLDVCLWAAMLEDRYGVRGGLLASTRSRLARILGHADILARYDQAVQGLRQHRAAA